MEPENLDAVFMFTLVTGQKLTQATEAAIVQRNIDEIATSLTDFDAVLMSDDIGKVITTSFNFGRKLS